MSQAEGQAEYHIRQLTEHIEPPPTGKQSAVLLDNEHAKIIVFAFAAGAGLSEHTAPLPATIQIIQGQATLTVAAEAVAGKPGTWIQMQPGTRHSVHAESPLIMLLTLIK